jgi:hypothetical protein
MGPGCFACPGSVKEVERVNGDQIRAQRGGANALQAEECCYRYWKIGGGMILGGLVMMLIAVLFPIGVMLVAAGATVIVGNIVWFLRVRQQQGIMVACPSCGKEYNILPGSHNFVCDECQHIVPIPGI